MRPALPLFVVVFENNHLHESMDYFSGMILKNMINCKIDVVNPQMHGLPK